MSTSRPCATFFFVLLLRRRPRSTLLPYTTLFRSAHDRHLEWSRYSSDSTGSRPARASPQRGQRTRSRSPTSPAGKPRRIRNARSEEHTSELQSLRHLVCRLLLEKKTQAKHSEEPV